mmetsp:Transcript_30165/g.70400  ORF Transcript_30165/g.70400 Transcript_30165/m.70400 type:complete len:85 (+) Transcript_30165:38-292(+)
MYYANLGLLWACLPAYMPRIISVYAQTTAIRAGKTSPYIGIMHAADTYMLTRWLSVPLLSPLWVCGWRCDGPSVSVIVAGTVSC